MADKLLQVNDSAMDKAGVDHWDDTYVDWKAGVFDVHSDGIRYHARRKWHALFTRLFHSHAQKQGSLIEIGCGGSRYLPYFAKEYCFSVSGIDYSEKGCALAEKNLELADIKGNIHYGDLFSPPQELIGSFDVAVSLGLVEHFSDTAYCIEHIVRLLRPGGLIYSSVPNMKGLAGIAQKYLGRDIYEKHKLLTKDNLVDAHRAAGLEVLESGYLEFLNFGVVNTCISDSKGLRRLFMTFLHKGLLAFTVGVWTWETIFGSLPGNSLTSPYVYCVARLPK